MAKGRENKSTAVMAQRAPSNVESDSAQTKLFRALDFYPTPPWAARAGAELVKFLDPQAKTVWEPACGAMHMAGPLAEFFSIVRSSDIHDFGVEPDTHGCPFKYDFLKEGQSPIVNVDWIITNPPFLKAAEFVKRGLEVATHGVAVLCRLSFLESAARYPLFFKSKHPLSHVAYFVERVPMQLGLWNPKGSTATAYAWFIFHKKWPSEDRAPEIMAIPPGTRARLTRPDDVRRFAHVQPMPLFEGAAT
jgi:hypothetical protein